jgi:hypothetical protein
LAERGVQGRLFDEIAELIPGQAQFREDEKVGLGFAGPFDAIEMEAHVAGDVAELRGDLGESDLHPLTLA